MDNFVQFIFGISVLIFYYILDKMYYLIKVFLIKKKL